MATRKRKAGSKPGTSRRASPRVVRGSRKASSATRRTPQELALADVARVIAALDAPAAVIGGIAVISYGFARLTNDIDCAVSAPREDAALILRAFEGRGFKARNEDPLGFAEENLVLLLRHEATGVELDVSLAQLEFESEALASAEPRAFGQVRVPMPLISDLLTYKALAGRPRDHQDIVELLALGYEVDTPRIERALRWFDELMDTDRLGDWRRLQRSTR
jgi:hypothetical protein